MTSAGLVSSTPYPPIFTLPQEVLEEILIFRVNNKPPVIRDVKSISQVCHHWREIVVGFPSLWGRVISLGELNQPRDDWRIEVLRRTKTSALHIFGIVDELRTLDFVLSLMEAQWSRIRRLELDILASLPADLDHRWRAILQPAPLLQSFVLDIHKRPYAALTSPRKPLFGDHAPHLQIFVPSAIDYNLRGSWTSTLRRLELPLKHPFTIPQLLEALKYMKQLEYLQINPNGFQGVLDNVDQVVQSPHVSLPHLEYIEMEYARFWTAISLLDHIYPAPGCAVSFSTLELRVLEQRFEELQRIISRYTENYYDLGIATDFHLLISSSHFSITDPSPRIRPMSIEWAIPGPAVAEFLSLFSQDSFSNVTHLLLFATSDCANDKIAKFVSCFPSLQTLHILPTTMQHIREWHRTTGDSTIPFPLLHTLQISAELSDDDSDSEFVRDFELEAILDFLLWRNDIGAPIAVLVLVDCEWDASDLDFLEDMEGLDVIWTTLYGRKRSYVDGCGSGQPKRLDLRR